MSAVLDNENKMSDGGRDRARYDEATYLAALTLHGSPLAVKLEEPLPKAA